MQMQHSNALAAKEVVRHCQDWIMFV